MLSRCSEKDEGTFVTVLSIVVIYFLSFSVFASGPSPRPLISDSDTLQKVAEYHFLHQDYEQSFQLWNRVLEKNPESIFAVTRVGELKLMFEGREASLKLVLGFLRNRWDLLSTGERDKLLYKLRLLGETFLGEEGQSLYLQAMAKINLNDCASALELLNRALVIEKGNLKVLSEKARCEKSLQNINQWYGTLKAAYENYPWGEVVEELAEAHIYFRDFDKVTDMLSLQTGESENLRRDLVQGVALFETGKVEQAMKLFQKMLEMQKNTFLHPIVFYILGVGFSKRSVSSLEGASYLKKFIAMAESADLKARVDWDPYRTVEKIENAKKLLAAFERT